MTMTVQKMNRVELAASILNSQHHSLYIIWSLSIQTTVSLSTQTTVCLSIETTVCLSIETIVW